MALKTPLRRRLAPSVPFLLKIDGEEPFELGLRLALDFNGLCLVEERTGISMLTDINEIFTKPTATNTSVVLWACLQINHPEYVGDEGLDCVRTFVTVANAREVIKACMEAFLTQLPKEQAETIRSAMKSIEQPEAKKPPLEETQPA